jgi:hypothetical protein
MLRVQLGYVTLNSGAHSHFCHSAYVTWSDVELWSAHMPARLLSRGHYPHVTWAHVMLRVQLGYLTLNSGAHSHFCHSAYVTWSDVDPWSAHMPARLLNFCWRTHFERFYCVTSYLTEKLSKLCSFYRQYRRPQNCPFQSSFTQRNAQFTQGIPQFSQFTCRHHDAIISRHIRF